MCEATVAKHIPVWDSEAERCHIRIRQNGGNDTKLQKPLRNHPAAERQADCKWNCGM